MQLPYATLASSSLIVTVAGQKSESGLLNGTSCIALEEFEPCRTDVLNDLNNDCLTPYERGSPYVCHKRAAMLNCFGSYCWNYICGCEYQETIYQLMSDCYLDPVFELGSMPFWRAPSEGSGVCSCNFASMEQDLVDVSSQYDTCINNRRNDSRREDLDCYCCSTSRTVSFPIDAWPKTDFTFLFSNASEESTGFDKLWIDCGSVLERVDCSEIGYKALSSANLYQPSNLPLPGAESFSNLSGHLSTPVSGWKYSWTISTSTKQYVLKAFSPTGTAINIPTTSVAEGGKSSGPTPTIRSADVGPTGIGSAAPSTTSTSSGAYNRTRPLRSQYEQIVVIVVSLLLIILLVAAGMYF
ncbi:hypothetical protein BKA64DRAFT_180103 [Cadophora sp. MPI-SDFR-AT-0126]|nr:hypothetical protein BKA64DRAFT_180103 [Leotiomycetes sp. MPI-SDFR-AT-0126]